MKMNVQTTGLKQIIVVFGPRPLLQLRSEAIARLREATALIDGRQLLDDVVVEAVEHDQDDTAAGREAEQAVFGEAVRLQLAILERSNGVLVFLRVAIERGEVEVGGCLRVVEVGVVGLKQIC